MTDLNALKDQRAALVAELEELEASLPALKEAVTTAPSNWSHLAMPIGSPQSKAAHEALEAATTRIQIIAPNVYGTGALDRLGTQIAHIEAVATADERISRASAEEKEAGEQVARLSASIERIAQRGEEMHTKAQSAEEVARAAEREAAQAMAKATATGDDKARSAAQDKMNKAIDAVRAAQSMREANLPLITAFEAELAALEKQLATARREEDTARQARRSATAAKLGDEWDRAVGVLTAIGARLISEGGVSSPLNQLKLPMFAPGEKVIDHDYLRAQAKAEAA
ncbi:hypothetical protein V8Z77_08235 [Stutzerimonas stutzeri]|uniref:hypothetical protein n=1 Tax=Stutzerimonas stutzeri TaxID=316 RepID=UPI000C9BBB3D|nr:hypothetical protein [Stutzerimonas stutzeri]PNG13428.1 hypothetical protein CXK97_14750 [Stutzerimonas stutzeri]